MFSLMADWILVWFPKTISSFSFRSAVPRLAQVCAAPLHHFEAHVLICLHTPIPILQAGSLYTH